MEEKAAIRVRLLARRNSLPENLVNEASSKIKEKLFALPEFSRARTVLLYAAKDKEVRTEAIIRESLAAGKRVALPVTEARNKQLRPVLLNNYKELIPGPYGVLVPQRETARVLPGEEIELVILPGIAFDRQGNRLGFGGGYYDSFLKGLPRAVLTLGLAYQFQIEAELPREKWDVPVQGIITEKESIFVDR